ncbi:kinase-like domain-containing protein [Trichoderma barbatum]
MSVKNRATQMFISSQELRKGAERQPNNGSLPPIDEDIPQSLKRRRQDNNRIAKVARIDTKRPGQTLKRLFPYNQGELYQDQYKGQITLLDLDGEVNIVQRKGSSEYFTARRLHTENANNLLFQLNEMRHENLIATIEVFTEGDTIYIVADNMPLSLKQIVLSPPIPTAKEIGTIMGQVLDGLVYLLDKGFVHGTLNCPNVLINANGSVKLTTHNLFSKVSEKTIAKDRDGVAEICMKLMQKYKLDIGKVGVRNIEHLGNSDILDFLSSTTSCYGAKELRQHQFISGLWSPESGWPRNILRGLVLTTELSVPRNFRHSAEAIFNES